MRINTVAGGTNFLEKRGADWTDTTLALNRLNHNGTRLLKFERSAHCNH